MRITRTIDGKEYEFELTTQEMAAAYDDVQTQFDRDDVSDVLSQLLYDGDLNGYEREKLEALIPEMAFRMRHDIDKHGDEWWYFAKDAINEVISLRLDNEEVENG